MLTTPLGGAFISRLKGQLPRSLTQFLYRITVAGLAKDRLAPIFRVALPRRWPRVTSQGREVIGKDFE